MATILQQYEEALAGYRAQAASGSLRPGDLMALQETSYRACVLGTVQAIGASIPPNTNVQAMGLHYAAASAYLNMLVREHRFGPGADEGTRQRREELKRQLAAIIQAMENKCSHLNVNVPDSYRTCMDAVLGAAIPVWLEYRDTYVCLRGQEAAGTAQETGPDAYMGTGSRNQSATNPENGNTGSTGAYQASGNPQPTGAYQTTGEPQAAEPYQTSGNPKPAGTYQTIGNPKPSGPYQAGGNPQQAAPYQAYGNPQPTAPYQAGGNTWTQAGGNAQPGNPQQNNWNTETPAQQYQTVRDTQSPGQYRTPGGQWAAPAQQPAGGHGRPPATAWQPPGYPYRNAG